MSQRRNQNGNKNIFWAQGYKNITFQSLRNVPKTIFRDKFVALNACIKTERRLKTPWGLLLKEKLQANPTQEL